MYLYIGASLADNVFGLFSIIVTRKTVIKVSNK